MKHFLVFLAVLAIAPVAKADSTTDALHALMVEDNITLSLGTDNAGATVINYSIDSNTSPKSANGLHFRSDGEIAIRIGNFSPLAEKWVVESKGTPDPSFTAIKAFLEDLKALQDSLDPDNASVTKKPGEGPPAGGSGEDAGCTSLRSQILEAYKALVASRFDAKELKRIVTISRGNAGVNRAYDDLVKVQQEIKADIETARKILIQIRSEFGSLLKAPMQICNGIDSRILIDYVEVYSTAEQIIAKKETLRQQLGELSLVLDPYRDSRNWQGSSLADYAIHRVTPTFAELQNVTASAQVKTIQLAGDTIEVKTGTAVVAKIDVRRNTLFVAERAVAVIYNSLTYPQYGTETTDDGKMIVRRIDDHEPIDGAVMLNLVFRLRSPSVVYPFLQIGVSSAKDFPGLLAGVGGRFVEPFNFSISVGGMITRYKDLDGSLRVGDEVSGSAEIQEHLELKNSDVAAYVAIQVKF